MAIAVTATQEPSIWLVVPSVSLSMSGSVISCQIARLFLLFAPILAPTLSSNLLQTR